MISSQIFLSIVILNQLASQLACRQIRSRGLAATACEQLQLAIYLARYLFFFHYYLANPGPTLGHYRGDSLTHPMLITAFYIFDPKVTGSLVPRLGPEARPSAQWGLNREPSNSYYNALTHQATLPKDLGDCQQLSSCLTKPPDLLFLVVLYYSFYIISRHHLSQSFRTSVSFNIIMKKRFLSQNFLLINSLEHKHPQAPPSTPCQAMTKID